MPHYRTIFLSDVHLGMRGCQAESLLDFLRHHEAERWVLVGDIIDGWALARSWHWPQSHNDVVQKLLRKARHCAAMTFVPGNHDAAARQFAGLSFGGIAIRRDTVHTTADGRRLLVLHGDEFDGAVRFAPWLSRVGAHAYEAALALNTVVARIRARLGRPYWSLARALKDRTKTALQYIDRFEEAVAARAAEVGADGVVCGHIHRPEVRHLGGVLYANCGDWVESCTALVEHADGRLEIIRWTDRPPCAAAARDAVPIAVGHPGGALPRRAACPVPAKIGTVAAAAPSPPSVTAPIASPVSGGGAPGSPTHLFI